MKRAFAALFFFLPNFACAETPSRQEFSFFSSFLQMIAALAIVVGLILVARHFSSRLLGHGLGPRLASRHIRLVETRYLSPKRSLIIVEVGGEYLLLSDSESGLSLIKQVAIIEEIEVVDDGEGSGSAIAGLLRRVPGKRSS